MECIRVEDASGCEFQVHEYRGRRTVIPTRRYVLVETGEPVSRIDDSTFVIATSGEPLVRLAAD